MHAHRTSASACLTSFHPAPCHHALALPHLPPTLATTPQVIEPEAALGHLQRIQALGSPVQEGVYAGMRLDSASAQAVHMWRVGSAEELRIRAAQQARLPGGLYALPVRQEVVVVRGQQAYALQYLPHCPCTLEDLRMVRPSPGACRPMFGRVYGMHVPAKIHHHRARLHQACSCSCADSCVPTPPASSKGLGPDARGCALVARGCRVSDVA